MIIEKFDGAGGVVFESNRKTGIISSWIGPGLENGKSELLIRILGMLKN